MIDALFIAGTDTDVGKTVASKAILQAYAEKGLSTIGYKPVSAGCEKTEQGLRNGDALHLLQAATEKMPYEDINPFALELPTSPHIAAKHQHQTIEYSVLSEKLLKLKAHADVVLVEGAGGWRVPISDNESLSSWVQQEQLPVVLVVGIKLGCLSHALLTAESIRSDGLNLVGWVANRVNPGTEHYADIISLLEARLDAPKLGEIPYMPSVKRRELGRFIDISPLLNIK
ncbi:ATP-dependent dethiobiotin synthetase BioD [Vibrio sp. V27_P1S3P104]|uniref:dethiobiotin synthase n=1 Tax=Vibrio TaxID=662 RepID=UPI000C1737ED|nr:MULTISPECIES: dethiobiotin synthase [Vibrio]NAW68872.1 ATP-dependent dethiobiotin synthetase BioD [Vibrio sp. V28_P6S34P95]NAX04071.1 ATP-dependent dethiobiotin synthetase BioD [Vibrio sp. V30_P3S12P165]NAX33984.1 ATP-dependent dethiobiotin synthetase BioD [Vibrio sp. V29_P1S30P107]NAX36263.1 ATP-dependent dethiobiotin synthetase BioD [Vibrio sp. V27_P1S3P104]NAX41478.1 ATP-dependent dethiobiotin synthetase BioD [Vibrio sp. V26_P1S5P106]